MMTQVNNLQEQDFIDGNKLISEFMNETIDVSKIATAKIGINNWQKLVEHQLGTNIPPYNESWDWLMHVVERIEDTVTIGQRCYISIEPYEISAYCSGVLEKNLNVFQLKFNGKYFNNEMKKDAVYKIVLAIIKWYNTKK